MERCGELGGPWLAGGDSESGSSAGAGDDFGGVKQGVADPFRFGSGEVTVQAQFLAPDEEVVSNQAGDQPGLVDRDDQTLLAQGRASAFAGQMPATVAVANLDGLAERFRDRGRFLDVGTGVGELGAAFAGVLPGRPWSDSMSCLEPLNLPG